MGSPLVLDTNAKAEVQILKQSSGYLSTQTKSDGNSVLITNLQFYPDWKVLVDKKSVPALRVNHAFMAAQIPPGEHQIEFKYSPRSFWLGLFVSTCSILIILGCWLSQKIISHQKNRLLQNLSKNQHIENLTLNHP